MEDLFPTKLLDLLVISITLSVIVMVILQKFKSLPFIKKTWQIWILNLLFSFSLSIPFTTTFYSLDTYSGIWVGLFTFVGAPAIYDTLKNQTIINYNPTKIKDTVEIDKKNEIKRDDI